MKKLLILLLFGFAICFGQTNTSLPQNPKMDLEVSYENNQLTFNIETNIPLPVEVMIGIEPKNSLPTDLAYGFSGRVKIDKSPIQFIRDAKDTYGLKPTDLKNGTYEADVVFYPFWGAKNGNPLAAEIKEKISGTYTVNIGSSKSEGSIKSAMDQSKKQAWGMDIAMKDKWIEKKFIQNLGKYQELKTKGRDPKIVKTYYFPEADMTFFVSKPLKQVLMWKFGKVDRL
tara:strand:- start:52 stop:735 length:684 start_codon:yes stop_codon:yes gene_type:complete